MKPDILAGFNKSISLLLKGNLKEGLAPMKVFKSESELLVSYLGMNQSGTGKVIRKASSIHPEQVMGYF